ncbi:NAD-glutamate dehydrogenase [Leptothrix cholodnii SP-6]|uniref:NAD-glutamate dehydrogenase n=1 Tax=Leptothrix cholodnii (strain ATCC 51168 / LMG 8142 / SP-6) TaxID=395495 RepID=B1Y879_LEPCP|nr:NAD-glutamate dehydrogenase [Leptothrix cholodnii]ACB34949.1 NAD-glutamate dehydrogenase [Leptothrix cholodnii SP-6]
MQTPNPESRQRLLEEAMTLAQQRLAPAAFAIAEPFLRHYHGQVADEQILGSTAADLFGGAMAHWQFARRFTSGTPRVRAYVPRVAEHGWESRHTVIEIVNDDMPFLVDSVTTEINRLGLTLHSVIHPVMHAWRDADGQLERLRPANEAVADGTGHDESYIRLEVDRCTDPARQAEIRDGIVRVLGDVRAAVEDWAPMQAAAFAAVDELKARSDVTGAAIEDNAEAQCFLRWMVDDHFTFLGCRDYERVEQGGESHLRGVAGSGLGLLRDARRDPQRPDSTLLPAGSLAVIDGASPLFLTKADSRATVHRPGYLDCVGVKRYDARGQVVGERRFLGLYTSSAYRMPASEMPLVRRKVATLMARSGFVPKGHLSKTLATVLEQYPRDELLQIGEDELLETALGILHLEERQRSRLFVRRDAFGRYVSCLVFVPRDRFNTELRMRIQQLLSSAFHGVGSEFNLLLSESVLARIHIIVRTPPGSALGEVDVLELEARIVALARRWQDDLADALVAGLGDELGSRLARRYAAAFPAGYREDCEARVAVGDIELAERAARSGELAISLYRPVEAAAGALRLKMLRVGQPIALSHSLPLLERMGVKVIDERSCRIAPEGGEPVWLHDFGMQIADGGEVEIESIKGSFEEAFAKVWSGSLESDDLNRLVLSARLSWREVMLLRAYARYIRQVGSTFSNSYIERALTANPVIARTLVELFQARFDLTLGEARAARCAALDEALQQQLDAVASIDEDRILRQFLGVIGATLRTNHFQRDGAGQPKPYLSFKFDPARVPGLPSPKPMFEIWVYSPRFEGVHLRGGKVARGGLRWSDRREDFRTEVLGLVKAQMVKNTVIVPVGSKGGFVVKQPPLGGDRDALLEEAVACYKNFLRGLLDLTDNLVAGQVVAPVDLVRHDGDDPYLVVAADKGTATFSDHANAVSAEYGFWLGDAFASGGSVGYDHKKMGITARGAWEAVKRHFREIGVNTQEQDFSVVGIGDMSGDVFGNGMLLSRHIRLVAAFDHRHIFLDPQPDAAASHAERARLFALPRSSWADYDGALISAGGGVFARSLKSIPLSGPVRAALGVTAEELSPAELMRAILQAPVDLFYNGGIGTYVKASHESHAQVGDRATDAIRVNGAELRCKVVAEGGNLGLTQLGRIEFARRGGRICTDAIDNSAGVDCSDHEVNIKILVDQLVSDGEMTGRQRNQLLADMTDEVGELVLLDNYAQTQALSVAGRRAAELLEPEARLMQFLERAGRLDRSIEFLPSAEEIAERKLARQGLTSPERAVLLAYSKMWLYDEILASDLPEEPYVAAMLSAYFPQALRQRHGQAMLRHPLKRQILATCLTNTLTNRIGPSFVHRLAEETGLGAVAVVRAAIVAREVFGLDEVWSSIDALDNRVPDSLQARLFDDVAGLMARASLWFLRQPASAGIDATVVRFRLAADQLGASLVAHLSPAEANALAGLQHADVQLGVPAELARRVASADRIAAVLDIAEVAAATQRSLELVAGTYFALDVQLQHGWMRQSAAALPADSHWQTLARTALQNDLTLLQRALTAKVVGRSPQLDSAEALVESWLAASRAALERYRRLLADLQSSSSVDLAMLSVATRELRAIEAA